MKDLFLTNDISKKLYSRIKDLPIIDYHNHLDPKEIYENKPFENISDIWLDHDHYKWRLMRYSGSSSQGSSLERFKNYASAVENAFLNPLYDWTKMELDMLFGIKEPLTSENAERIYNQTNNYLKETPFGPRDLLEKFNVEVLCTTDDVTSDLNYHQLIKDVDTSIRVLPTFRPDRLFHKDFKGVVLEELSSIEKHSIRTLDSLEEALINRLNHFEEVGCKLADHGITNFEYYKTNKSCASVLFENYLEDSLSEDELVRLDSYLLSFLMNEYTKRKWTVQLHIGALRNTNQLEFEIYGKDSGYDSISGKNFTNKLTSFLNDINKKSGLPRMIFYPLNSTQYEEIAVMCGTFSGDVPSKLQLGAAWWFHDHKTAIEKQLTVFAEYLNINHFMGMLTDSRSFFSFVRHDYFRRILVNFIGSKVDAEFSQLEKVVKNIAYENSKNYLDF